MNQTQSIRLRDVYPHRRAVTCRAGNLRDILEYAGHTFSETLLFGLSASVNFNYVLPHETNERAEFLLIQGQWHRALDELVCLLGLDMVVWSPTSETEKWRHIRQLIAENTPILLETVLGYYHEHLTSASIVGLTGASTENSEFSASWKKHFGQLSRPQGTHEIVLIGVEEEIAYIVENSLSAIQKLPIPVLQYACNPTHDLPLHPRGRYRTFYIPEELPPIDRLIRHSIASTIQRMIHPPRSYNGLPGLVKMQQDLPRWTDMFSKQTLRNTVGMMFYVSELASGGGMYRGFYARFLSEAARHLQDDRLQVVSKSYRDLATAWRQWLYHLVADPEQVVSILQDADTVHRFDAIVEMERENIEHLSSILSEWT